MRRRHRKSRGPQFPMSPRCQERMRTLQRRLGPDSIDRERAVVELWEYRAVCWLTVRIRAERRAPPARAPAAAAWIGSRLRVLSPAVGRASLSTTPSGSPARPPAWARSVHAGARGAGSDSHGRLHVALDAGAARAGEWRRACALAGMRVQSLAGARACTRVHTRCCTRARPGLADLHAICVPGPTLFHARLHKNLRPTPLILPQSATRRRQAAHVRRAQHERLRAT